MGLPPIPIEKFRSALERKGYKKDRSNGGHEVWEKTITKSCTIPIHGEVNGAMAKRLSKEHNLGLF